ncbi:ead/Ea22-like family protein [Enterobacter soli]|uniref:ead/Ea22-like family protein n=1 Tax=Enterobacter soli TaxID=885040 RepID=UPI002F41661B
MLAYAVQVAVLELRKVREIKPADEDHVAAMNSITAIIAILGLSDTLGISEQVAELKAQRDALAAENAGLKDFVKTCFRAAADGASLDGADIQELGERLGLFGRETYQPALHGYICGHEAGEDTVYVMKKTPATDVFLAEVRAKARREGAHFVANRMLAAWDAGFIDDTAKNAADIARMILTSTEFMADAPEGDFDRSFADGVLEDIAAQLRKGVQS